MKNIKIISIIGVICLSFAAFFLLSGCSFESEEYKYKAECDDNNKNCEVDENYSKTEASSKEK